MNIKSLLLGPNKYTTGLIFLLANLMGFFAKMKESNVSDEKSFYLLIGVIGVAYSLS
jgi:hypothetical protein